jgi:hypothetical protein
MLTQFPNAFSSGLVIPEIAETNPVQTPNDPADSLTVIQAA